RQIRRFLVALAALPALLAASRAWAQLLPIVNLATDDGLAAPQVGERLRDARGYLWIAPSAGLNRYDGFELQTISGADGLRNQVVRKILEAPDGPLWLGPSEG